MRRLPLALSMFFTATVALACSDGESGGDGGDSGGATGGSSMGGSGGTTGGSTTGGSTTGGSSTGGATTGGATTGGSSTGGASGASSGTGGSAGGGFTKTGICGQRSEATVMDSSYSGYEEFYLVSQEVVDDGRLDEFICLIRFDVMRVGAAPAGCVDLENMPCDWTHQVTFSNPQVITNVDNACDKVELMWNQAWRDGIDGTIASYGYIYMYSSHDSVVMKASGPAGSETWAVYGRASWEETTGAFSFDNRLGSCQY